MDDVISHGRSPLDHQTGHCIRSSSTTSTTSVSSNPRHLASSDQFVLLGTCLVHLEPESPVPPADVPSRPDVPSRHVNRLSRR
jgi:hypothetical protein